ncbi:MAG: Nramp family divalent metal transporter [Gemmatimonadota bacterium]|nr:Nramp family divalent metal transporter [Gemmatimonadota bacterium]
MKRKSFRETLKALGPGVITGAADDDPSGIATYSIAGAQFGTSLLWMAVASWPLMAGVQAMCARIGMVTGRGLMASLRARFPRKVLIVMSLALLVTNTINIGADLSGMADAAELLTSVNSHIYVVLFGVLIAWATVRLRYATLANVLKYLALVLIAYVITAFLVKPHWGQVAHDTFIPHVPDRSAFSMIVAILGTTISPYLFFWQAAQEVEEEKVIGRNSIRARQGATSEEMRMRRLDIGAGTFVSNCAMFFIILTTALTLHAHGMTKISTSREVATALQPLAGRFATLLYAVGLIGTGALAIPTLAGSAGYALSELFNWHHGIDESFRRAPKFYIVLVLAVLAGITLDFANFSAIQAMYWSAVLNGLLAPFLLVGILIVASDKALMLNQPSSRLSIATVGLTTVAMFAAGIAMFVV